MKNILILLICSLFLTPVFSEVRQDPRTRIWYGNICQTPIGNQFVPFQPVGSMCYIPAWNAYGFIAGY